MHHDPSQPAAAPTVPADAVARRGGPGEGLRPGHLYRAALLLLGLALVWRFFDVLTRTLLLAYAAALLAVAIDTVGRRLPLPLKRKGMAIGAGLLGLGLVVGLAWWGIPALVEQARSLAGMGPKVEALFSRWEAWLREATGLSLRLPRAGGGGGGGGVNGKEALGSAMGVVEILFVPVIVFFGALFALANPNDRLLTPLLRSVPAESRPAAYRILQLLGTRIRGWLKGTLTAMVAVGLLTIAAYSAIGVPNAVLLGLMAGLLEFIPLFGPWGAGAAATLVAFVEEPRLAIWTALAAAAIQQIEANVITPWAMSRQAEIHPFVTLFALVLFGGIFGFLGLLLALPLVILVWTVVQVLWVERALDTDRDRIAPVVRE